MATKKTAGRTPALDPKVADKLLDKLSTDNEFRRLFKSDPAAALVKVGHPKDAAALTGMCCQVQSIAPKAQIVKARDESGVKRVLGAHAQARRALLELLQAAPDLVADDTHCFARWPSAGYPSHLGFALAQARALAPMWVPAAPPSQAYR